MDYEFSHPEAASPATRARAPIDVAQREWSAHPLLKRAIVNSAGDGLDWPGSTNEQRATLSDISLWIYEDEFFARLDSEINLDFFVDSSTDEDAPSHFPFHQPDRQRYYTRVTSGGFHLVGGYSAITLEGRRRYFQWLEGGWAGVGLSGFLSVRDDEETLFSEVAPLEFTYLFPASSAVMAGFQSEGEHQTSRHRLDADPIGVTENYTLGEMSPPTTGPTAPIVPQGAIQRSVAIALATVALRGRTDRMGSALIDHAARVSESFDVVNDNVRHCAAWLHDVIECSDLSDDDLRDAGLLPEIVSVVRLLTHDPELAEDAWLSAIASDSDARAVKLAAIADNASPWRLRRLDEETQNEILGTLSRLRDALSSDSTS